jgi:uncharacterized transporter YbjL
MMDRWWAKISWNFDIGFAIQAVGIGVILHTGMARKVGRQDWQYLLLLLGLITTVRLMSGIIMSSSDAKTNLIISSKPFRECLTPD